MTLRTSSAIRKKNNLTLETMGLGPLQNQREPRKWLSIHHGQIELNENGQKSYYSYVEGRLLSIYQKERVYNGEAVLKWFIDLRGEQGELYTISFPYNSGTFKGIVLSLASEDNLSNLTTIRIEPYQKGNFTNVKVWADGVKLDWITKDLPPLEEVVYNGRKVKDETKRMAFISQAVGVLSQRLSRK